MNSSFNSKVIGSILLIAGTQIGAGMLALPMSTGVAGFLPSLGLFIFVFIYMLLNIFVLLEAVLYCKVSNVNIIGIVKFKLGKFCQFLAWGCFLLLMYAALTAYIAEGGSLLATELKPLIVFSNKTGSIVFSLFFASVAYFGIVWIDRLNRLLMVGLFLSYIISVFCMSPKVQSINLLNSNPVLLWAAIPVVIASFTSHIVIPSLADYLNYDIKNIKKAVIIGSVLPFLFYLIWEFVVVGAIPLSGDLSLLHIASMSNPVASLTDVLFDMHLPLVANSSLFFAVFAMITSFLGVVLSLCDFLADGLGVKKDSKGRMILMFCTCAPPLFLALVFPGSFIAALGYAGAFIAILYGVLPAMVVYKARYVSNLPAPKYRFFGNKLMLLSMIMIACMVIVLQVMTVNHWL
jgi:tyrosine-specific transport protein